jgi:putative SOS response-associated peptidase YedK
MRSIAIRKWSRFCSDCRKVPAYQPRYNIAPTAQVLVVREGGAAMVKWGLVPRWAKDPSMARA